MSDGNARREIAGGRFALFRPEFLVFLPALALALLWYGPGGLALASACALPTVYLSTRQPTQKTPAIELPRDGVTDLPLRAAAIAALDAAFAAAPNTGRTTACLVAGIDEADDLVRKFGEGALTQALQRTAERLSAALRGADLVVRLDGARFGVALAPVRRADLESVIQLAARLQSAAEAPLSIDAATVYLRISVGFCLANRSPGPSGVAILSAAESAMDEAQRCGPGAIRAFSAEVQAAIAARALLQDEVEDALEDGMILPYFQPQLSNDTGAVSGFEALARWMHPKRGLLPPSEFLHAIETAGLSSRLSEVVLFHSFSALKAWDRAGLKVPAVAVNFSREELRNPKLPEKLKWELDRFDLEPERLVVEVLESVVAESANDVIVRNIAALAQLGCGIDLDDFGTGHASIASIRRFDVDRIKIDRSFVTRVDTDKGQQEMVAAILSMAERLGLATLAEGVETIGEHAMLAQLGCSHVQGFGIARPMPFEGTIGWLERHRTKLQATPSVGRRTG
ncbi:GGDEF domain-containing phosphodiesterase [Ostreiculturibacter nitratireducens]|uniref:GGDEF domain-containing phosphodiesterase n=1 Tax=Ostreiculturibacter nitratireducens TaxID=3075226 RepID=UPI0031B5A75B